ncbi:hypothetical protein OKW21_004705 [Catalinimonas alkaloidigena]|nr:hypothetical protein [Catalinimonas alkaloidigena]MDF9799442.1 hypothetical protein [Catalinimonas alkaloidigena]
MADQKLAKTTAPLSSIKIKGLLYNQYLLIFQVFEKKNGVPYFMI